MHGRIMCSCGAIVAQCRCLDNGTVLEVRERGCADCRPKQPWKGSEWQKPPKIGLLPHDPVVPPQSPHTLADYVPR